jgi:hypothetical protein
MNMNMNMNMNVPSYYLPCPPMQMQQMQMQMPPMAFPGVSLGFIPAMTNFPVTSPALMNNPGGGMQHGMQEWWQEQQRQQIQEQQQQQQQQQLSQQYNQLMQPAAFSKLYNNHDMAQFLQTKASGYRGSYKCRMCGEPKIGHICKVLKQPNGRSRSQSEEHDLTSYSRPQASQCDLSITGVKKKCTVVHGDAL